MIQKRLAADIFDCSEQKVRFDTERLGDIKEAITKADVRSLIKQGAIWREQDKGVSKARFTQRLKQRRRNRRRGPGSRKGTAGARTNSKDTWMAKVRSQRVLVFHLRERNKITDTTFRTLYNKVKGGFFRSTHHIKIYCEEQKLFK